MAFKRSGGDTKDKRWAFDFLACALILATHFINYLMHAGYDRVIPDLAVAGAILTAVAAAITLLLQIPLAALRTLIFALLVVAAFSDSVFEYGTTGGGAGVTAVMVTLGVVLILCFVLRRHINKILIAVFAAMLVSLTVSDLVPGAARPAGDAAPAKASTADRRLPVVVHIVLDEHAGLAAMAPDLPGGDGVRAAMNDFYVGNGFRLFARAHSRYFETHASLARMFNPDLGIEALGQAEKHRNHYVLTGNDYFREWAEKGYEINVLQSSYLDFCQAPKAAVKSCRTYRHDAVDPDTVASLPVADRVELVLRMYASSLTLVKLARLTDKVAAPYLRGLGLPVPAMDVWHGRVGPLAAAAPLDAFIREVGESRGGEMFFAHLLMPHYPYVYDSQCRIKKPIGAWRLRTERGSGRNSPEGRRIRYEDYFRQVRCTLRKLAPLVAAMRRAGTYDDAVIVVHGDHGSRIVRVDPTMRNSASMTREDFVDSFSTLFAVKAPGISAGIDPRMAPLTELLRGTVPGHGGDMQISGQNAGQPFAYLRGQDDAFVKIGMPEFPVYP